MLKTLTSRRSFLKFSGGCAALTSTPVLNTLLQMRMINSAAAANYSAYSSNNDWSSESSWL